MVLPCSTVDIVEGQILAGKYRIERVLGKGGMGVVVAATHIHLGEKVALKFLLPDALEHPAAVERFQREARAAVRIKGEHVARVGDVGTLDSGVPYMVMEYLVGSDLSTWLKQRGRLPVEQASDFVLQACEAIAEAHSLGIVHRDLKPANLFVSPAADGTLRLKVLDFGISKIEGSVAMTRTTGLMGSPLYMSPEQLRSPKDVDSRTDIWSLGVVLFELLAGRPPFTAESIPELTLKITLNPVPSIRQFWMDVPESIEQVLQCCLEKERTKRYQTVGHLAVDLLPFASRRSRSTVERITGILRHAGMIGAEITPLPPSEPSTPSLVNNSTQLASGTHSAWSQSHAPKGKRRGTLTMATAATVFVATGIIIAQRVTPSVDAESQPASSIAAAPPMLVEPTGNALIVPSNSALSELHPPAPSSPTPPVAPSATESPTTAATAATATTPRPLTTPHVTTTTASLKPSPARQSKPITETPLTPRAQPPATPSQKNPLQMELQ
jgi:serine/threonine protein kinase